MIKYLEIGVLDSFPELFVIWEIYSCSHTLPPPWGLIGTFRPSLGNVSVLDMQGTLVQLSCVGTSAGLTGSAE